MTISLDIETYSSVDIAKSGVYRYAESDDFEILLLSYSLDEGEIHTIDLARGEKIPEKVLKALVSDDVKHWAYNSSFERICLSSWLRKNRPDLFNGYGREDESTTLYLSPYSWYCDMVLSAYSGLPLSLKGVGAVLKLDEQKDENGKPLIRFFCTPNSDGERNYYYHDIIRWEEFKDYNAQDVRTELAIHNRLNGNYPVPDSVWEEYHVSETINDRGIRVDMDLVRSAIALDKVSREDLTQKLSSLTLLDNPNSVSQMKSWLKENGIEAETLGKKAVETMLKDEDISPEIRESLSLRLQLAKSSIRKYDAIESCVCRDGRVHGMFMFYGANRTGRFSGRIVQLQNLRQNHIEDLENARETVKTGDSHLVEALYDDVPDTLSQLIRTAFIPKEGYKFIVADYSAIEARVLAYLANEQWRIDAFARGDDIYCAAASQMFKVPVVKHGINGELRQRGKVAELACIAEGQLVLTDRGLIPIEEVTLDDKVWDGEEWVKHEGVIYKGEREVITYEGLTATPEHLVWVEGKTEPVYFGLAASSGAHLVKTGDGGKAIRLGENYKSGEKMESKMESLLCPHPVSGMRFNTMAGHKQSQKRQNERVSELLAAQTNTYMVGEKTRSSKEKMRKQEGSSILKLWRTRYKVLLSQCCRCRALFTSNIRNIKQRSGIRQNQHKRRLCPGEPAPCRPQNQLCQSTQKYSQQIRTTVLAIFQKCSDTETFIWADKKRDNRRCPESCTGEKKELATYRRTARLYDIRNAGRHHRFTVSGHLVHNCGYGGGVGALKAMGALDMGLKEEDLKPLVDSWRAASPNIVQFWWDADEAVKTVIRERTQIESHGLLFEYKSGMLFITLPSGRHLSYVKPRIEPNQYGAESITYEGVGNTKKWERLESYGPKFVENITQAVSRDILCSAMTRLKKAGVATVAHVHDETINEVPMDMTVDEVAGIMSISPEWMKDINLTAAGYECSFYMKD